MTDVFKMVIGYVVNFGPLILWWFFYKKCLKLSHLMTFASIIATIFVVGGLSTSFVPALYKNEGNGFKYILFGILIFVYIIFPIVLIAIYKIKNKKTKINKIHV